MSDPVSDGEPDEVPLEEATKEPWGAPPESGDGADGDGEGDDADDAE